MPEKRNADNHASEGRKAPRRLLVATDLSARSDRALERAVQLARDFGSHLTVLHVLDEDLPGAVQDRVAAAAREEIETFLGKLPDTGSLDLTIDIVPGKDYRDILARAEADAADLVIMGLHRNESGDTPLAGTTLERVLRKGRQPVLVVPAHVKGAYRNVLIGVDFSVFSRIALRQALSLAPQAKFHLVHAYQVPFEGFQPGEDTRREIEQGHEQELTRMIEEELIAYLAPSTGERDKSVALQKILRKGGPREVLRAEVDHLAPDLMVLGTHSRTGLSHALLGSVAEDFLNRPPCDVLVVKAW